jgi:hypothetical protein
MRVGRFGLQGLDSGDLGAALSGVREPKVAVARCPTAAPMSMATASKGGMRFSPSPPNVPATIQPCSARLRTSMVRAVGSTNHSQGTPCFAVDVLLAGAVHDGGRRREHFADPIGRQGEPCGVGECGHAFATPAGQIRNQNVRV